MRRCLILCLFTFISSLVCWADAGKDAYLFRKVDYQQGLSNSAVLCLYQDKAGLMWFAGTDLRKDSRRTDLSAGTTSAGGLRRRGTSCLLRSLNTGEFHNKVN